MLKAYEHNSNVVLKIKMSGTTNTSFKASAPKYNAVAVWDDLRNPLTAATGGAGANAPAFVLFRNNGAGSRGVYLYNFPSNAGRELFLTVQLPHSYKEGTDLYPHIHFVTSNNVLAGTVRWGLEYTVANMGSSLPNVFSTTSIITADAVIAAGQAYLHQTVSFPAISGTGLKISAILVCRLYRDVTVAGNYGTGIFGLELDFHYQKDTDGSRQQFNK